MCMKTTKCKRRSFEILFCIARKIKKNAIVLEVLGFQRLGFKVQFIQIPKIGRSPSKTSLDIQVSPDKITKKTDSREGKKQY